MEPIQIRKAWTLGKLYDTGPYPAMIRGEDRVAGQVWTFADADYQTVLQVLDEIECTNQPGVANEYDREKIIAVLESGTALVARTYIFAKLEMLPSFEILPPEMLCDNTLYSVWPRGSDW